MLTYVNSWKLRNPGRGYAEGDPLFSDPKFKTPFLIDWIVMCAVPSAGLQSALSIDQGPGAPISNTHPLVRTPRSHIETYVAYGQDPAIPNDGTHIKTGNIVMLSTSRGTVTLESGDAQDSPRIDPRYYSTEADKFVMRTGLRNLARILLETPEGQAIIESEKAPDGFKPITSTSTDEEIDARVVKSGR